MENRKNPAMVFNCHYNGLSIIQELGRHQVRVYALDSTRSVGTVSRYADFMRCPDVIHDEQGLIDFLLEKGSEFDLSPVLFPVNDEWAMAISKHKRLLENHYIPCVADYAVVDTLVSKDKFYKWAMEKGYPVPKTFSYEEVNKLAEDDFPVIAKPKHRRLPGVQPETEVILKKLKNYRMVMLSDQQALSAFVLNNPDVLQHMIFQEYVPGMADMMYTVGVYASRSNEVLAVFTGRKKRGFPPDIGDCIVGQAERVAPELVSLAKSIVKDIGYHGIAEFEFKRNAATGQYRLIEINPRSWSWVGITPACGVSLPWIAYCDLTGDEHVDYLESAVDNGDVKYIKFIEDMINCVYLYRKSGYPSHGMGLRHWWRSLDCEKKVYAEFSRDDPFVGLYSFVYLLNLYLLSRQRLF